MIELRRRLIPLRGPILAAIDGNSGAAVVAVDHAVGTVGINPQSVVVAVRGVQAFEGFAAVDGAVEASIGDVNLIGILGVGPNVGEIPGALTEAVIVVDERPVRAAIVAAVEAALFRFDERVNDVGLGAGNRNADAAERTFGDAVAFDALPGGSVVARTVEAILGSATVERPRSAVAFPHCGEEHMRILRIEDDVDSTGAVVKIEDFFPSLTTVARSENPAFGVGAVGMAKSCDESNIGIGGMDNDGTDVASVFQSNVVPGFAAIVRAVDTVAKGNVAANAGFATAHIDHIGIGIGDSNGANGRGGLLLEERIPSVASVSGFPNASADSTKIESVGLAGDACDSQRASATEGADEAPFHAAVSFGIDRIDDRRNVTRLSRFGWLVFLRH